MQQQMVVGKPGLNGRNWKMLSSNIGAMLSLARSLARIENEG
jgi:hypothetical protein